VFRVLRSRVNPVSVAGSACQGHAANRRVSIHPVGEAAAHLAAVDLAVADARAAHETRRLRHHVRTASCRDS